VDIKRATLLSWLLAYSFGLISGYAGSAGNIPHLEKRDGMIKLIVDDQPFICVAGELANSSSSDVETMKSAWPRLAKMNLNTILSVISWDLVEPQEGKYDFWMVDYQIQAARANHLRLIFLWMASWKNGMSHYPPTWVKANQDRFPRAMDARGQSLEVISTLSQASRDADARAFAALMKHIRQIDSKDHTVIAIQVENEVGLIAASRDHCPAANEAFTKPVPRELTDYLQRNKDHLLPELKNIWVAAGSNTSGNWEEVFGKNVPFPSLSNPNQTRLVRTAGVELLSHADEIFMAWNYSRYIGYVAAQGKKQYPLPMFVNAWLVNPTDRGPGDYPSGGPEPLVHDIWRAGAPAIDILAPDIYLPEFAQIIQTFARNGNPAWIPETRQVADNCWNAFAQLNALCYSHMGIDNFNNWFPESPFARTVNLVGQISGAIAEAQGKKDAIKLITLAPGENPGKVEMGDYIFDFTIAAVPRVGDTATQAPRPTPAAATTDNTRTFLDIPFVLIINTAPNEYYFATDGNFPFRVSTRIPGANTAAAATIDRGYFNNGKWILSHRLNGDDIMTTGDLSGAAAKHQSGSIIPLGSRGRWNVPFAPVGGMSPTPTIWRVTFYQYH
jgi:hypothetical protein